MAEYTTIEQAKEALEQSLDDVRGDYGDEAEELIDGGGHRDMVVRIVYMCTPEVARELCRRELGYTPHEHLARLGNVESGW